MLDIYKTKEKWAVAYASKELKTKIHTTSRVESLFSKIKRTIKQRASL